MLVNVPAPAAHAQPPVVSQAASRAFVTEVCPVFEHVPAPSHVARVVAAALAPPAQVPVASSHSVCVPAVSEPPHVALPAGSQNAQM